MLCAVTLAVPLVSLRSDDRSTTPVTVRAGSYDGELALRRGSDRADRSTSGARRLLALEESQTTTTTAPPPPPPTTAKPVPTTARPPVTAAARPTTTAAPRPTTTAPPANTQEGKASWYEEAPAGTCAHRTIAKGTIVTVTNVANGNRVQCRVADRGPYVEGWIIDLSKDTFSQLAPTSAGVISVRITW